MKNKFQNTRWKFNSLLFITIGFLLTSCASMSTLQTARTTEKNEFVGGFSGGAVHYDTGVQQIQDSTSTKTYILNMPFVEGYARYGITDKLDMGAKLTIIGTFLVDAKYQFLGNGESKIAGSAGLGLGTLTMKIGDYTNKIKDIHAPFYFSFHPAKWIGLYVSPRYVYRINSSDDGKTKRNFASSWYGATGGVRLGNKAALFIEYSYFGNSETPQPFTQFTVGLGFGIR